MTRHAVILGAGIAGVTAAIALARAEEAKFPNNPEKRKKIIVLDKGKDIFSGASAIFSEGHGGCEYPEDLQSGEDCLEGFIALMKLFPNADIANQYLFNNKGSTRIFVSNKSSDKVLPMRNHIIALKKHYIELIHRDPTNKVLGEPDEAFREMNRGEYKDRPTMTAGFITPQRGLSLPYLATLLKSEANRLGVEFEFNNTVQSVKKLDAQNKPLSGEQFQITATDTLANEHKYQAHEVILAGSHDSFTWAKQLNPSYPVDNVHTSLRRIVLLKIPGKYKDKLPRSFFPNDKNGTQGYCTDFTLSGSDGGMIAPIGGNEKDGYSVLVYWPDPNGSQVETQNNHVLPEDWKLGISDDNKRAQKIVSALYDHYPILKEPGVQIECSYSKTALIMGSGQLEQRRNFGPQQVVDGVWLLPTVKGTTAWYDAVNLAKKMDPLLDESTLSAVQKPLELNPDYLGEAGFDKFVQDSKEHASRVEVPLTTAVPLPVISKQVQPNESVHSKVRRGSSDASIEAASGSNAATPPGSPGLKNAVTTKTTTSAPPVSGSAILATSYYNSQPSQPAPWQQAPQQQQPYPQQQPPLYPNAVMYGHPSYSAQSHQHSLGPQGLQNGNPFHPRFY